MTNQVILDGPYRPDDLHGSPLGDVEPFANALVRIAQTQRFFDAPQSSITADGALG